MDPFTTLGIAANVAQFIDFGVRFMRLASSIRDKTFDEAGLVQIQRYLDNISAICAEFDNSPHALVTNPAIESAEDALLDLASICKADAAELNKSLKACFPTIPNHLSRSNSPPKITTTSDNSQKRRMKEQKHSFLKSFRAAFLLMWNREDIEENFKRLDWYRSELNLRTVAVLNLKANSLGIKVDAIHAQNETLAEIAGQNRNDIVEVLSINKTLLSTVETVAAILTCRNGESFTIPRPTAGRIQNNLNAETSSITYTDKQTNEDEDKDKDARPAMVRHDIVRFSDKIINALYYREESYRQEAITEAHKETFRWIFERSTAEPSFSNFRDWLEAGDGCYWINGKAGSGKSTLMNYIYQQDLTHTLLRCWSSDRSMVFISFFFWQAGTALQKSYEGMLRSLLYQILQTRRDLVPILFPGLLRFLLAGGGRQSLSMSLSELQAAFARLVKGIPHDLRLFVMIDGIDEYCGDHLGMCELFLCISQTPGIKVLVSGRPIPACFQVFSQCPSLRLQDLTEPDIRRYINDKLLSQQLMQDMDVLEPGFSEDVAQTLTEKAAGVFLWIILVVKDVLIGLMNYDEKNAILKRIESLPADLEKLYDHMFQSMSTEYQREASLMLQIVMRAVQFNESDAVPSLTVLQLSFMVDTHVQTALTMEATSIPFQTKSLWIKSMEGRMRSRCCGLIESTQNRKREQHAGPRVEFLHRTVKDYLINEVIWSKVTSLHQKSHSELNMLFLASTVYELKWSQPSSIDIHSWRASQIFYDCIQYSSVFARQGDEGYLKYLQVAESTMLQYCQQVSLTQRDDSGNGGSRLLFEHWTEQKLGSIDTYKATDWAILNYGIMDGLITSLLLYLFKGLTVFYERKLEEHQGNDDLLALLLYQFLSFRIQRHELSVGTVAEQIWNLLEAGADPNRKLTGTTRGVDKLTTVLVPWNYWRVHLRDAGVEPSHTDLDITLRLLDAGAGMLPTSSEEELKSRREFLAHFKELSKRSKDAKLQNLFKGIIKNLQVSQQLEIKANPLNPKHWHGFSFLRRSPTKRGK